MRLRTLPLFLLLVASAGAVRCAGCSAQCTGPENQGSDGCPCASDQDCTTRVGAVLLCTDGACKNGDPENAPAAACNADGDCGPGEACGIDDLCLPAPSCQRIDSASDDPATVQLSFADASSAPAALITSRDDCTHHWSTGGALATDITIDLDGTLHATGVCSGGKWFAAQRIGSVHCGPEHFVVFPTGDVRGCVDASCDAPLGAGCVVVGDGVGVCPP